MKRPKIIASNESNKGATLLMEKSKKKIPDQNDGNIDSIFMQDIDGGSYERRTDPVPPEPELQPTPHYELEMSPTSIDRVDSHIYIGNHRGASDLILLKNNGITDIINTASEVPNYFEGKFRYAKLGLTDYAEQKEDLSKVLEPVYRYILDTISKNPNAKIFIHCHAGVSRSATIVIYYLMRKYGLNFDQALGTLKTKRWIVNPNPWYAENLKNVSKH